MQSSTIEPKRLPERWLDMFCDSSVSTAPWASSFMVAAVSWSILASVSSCAQAIALQLSRSASACSGVVPCLVHEVVVENQEQPASSAASERADHYASVQVQFEIRRYLAGIA